MQQKLLRKAGLLGVVATALGFFIAGCVDEPNPPVYGNVPCTVRYVHAVKDVGAVDVWIDDVKAFSSMSYMQNSPYKADIKAGNRFIRLVPTGGDTSAAVYRRLVSFRSFMKMTAVFFDYSGSPEMLLTQERFTYSNETNKLGDTAQVKLINVNTSENQMKLVSESLTGPTLIGAVDAYSLSPYTKVLGGAYKMYVLNASDEEVKEINLTLTGMTRYSFIVVGTTDEPNVLTLEDDKN